MGQYAIVSGVAIYGQNRVFTIKKSSTKWHCVAWIMPFTACPLGPSPVLSEHVHSANQ